MRLCVIVGSLDFLGLHLFIGFVVIAEIVLGLRFGVLCIVDRFLS